MTQGECEHGWGQGPWLSLSLVCVCQGAGTQPCWMLERAESSPRGLPCPVNQGPLPTRAPCPGARV